MAQGEFDFGLWPVPSPLHLAAYDSNATVIVIIEMADNLGFVLIRVPIHDKFSSQVHKFLYPDQIYV